LFITPRLSSIYVHDSDVRKWLRSFVSKALVPPGKLEDAFLELENTVPIAIEQVAGTRKFLDYYVETWLDVSSTFDKRIWNHYNNDGARTTNNAEGFHSKLNRLAGRSHLNIFELIEVLQSIVSDNELQITRLKLGYPSKVTAKNYCAINDRVGRSKAGYLSGHLSLMEYIHSFK